MKNKNYIDYLKALIVVLICFLIDGFGHMILPASPYMDEVPASLVASILGKIPTAMIYIFILYLVLALVFLYISKFSKNRFRSGLNFGIALGGLWMIAFFESWSIFGSPFIADLIMGLNDSVPVLLIGLILGLWISKKEERKIKEKNSFYTSLWIFPLMYTIGRYIMYILIKIESGYLERWWQTLLWTISMGIWIALTYYWIPLKGKKLKEKIILFGLLIFGFNWVLYNLFVPVVLQSDIVDFLIRSLGDVFFVSLSVLFIEKRENRSPKRLNSNQTHH